MGDFNFTKLKAWERAFEVTLELYRITRGFPADEKFVLVPQIRRAGLSVLANIAEGCGRSTVKERSRFYGIARDPWRR